MKYLLLLRVSLYVRVLVSLVRVSIMCVHVRITDMFPFASGYSICGPFRADGIP